MKHLIITALTIITIAITTQAVNACEYQNYDYLEAVIDYEGDESMLPIWVDRCLICGLVTFDGCLQELESITITDNDLTFRRGVFQIVQDYIKSAIKQGHCETTNELFSKVD